MTDPVDKATLWLTNYFVGDYGQAQFSMSTIALCAQPTLKICQSQWTRNHVAMQGPCWRSKHHLHFSNCVGSVHNAQWRANHIDCDHFPYGSRFKIWS